MMGIDQDLTITRLSREKAAALASADDFREYAAQLEAEVTTVRAENCELRAAATLTVFDIRVLVRFFEVTGAQIGESDDVRAAVAKLRRRVS